MERCCCCIEIKDAVKYIGYWWIIISVASLANVVIWWPLCLPLVWRLYPLVIWISHYKHNTISAR